MCTYLYTDNTRFKTEEKSFEVQERAAEGNCIGLCSTLTDTMFKFIHDFFNHMQPWSHSTVNAGLVAIHRRDVPARQHMCVAAICVIPSIHALTSQMYNTRCHCLLCCHYLLWMPLAQVLRRHSKISGWSVVARY